MFVVGGLCDCGCCSFGDVVVVWDCCLDCVCVMWLLCSLISLGFGFNLVC